MLKTDIVRDENNSYKPLIIIEKFENYTNYIYPILQNIPRKHGYFKQEVISQLFHFVDLVNDAAKTNQISKLYLVDSCLASIRYKLRFMAHAKRKIITQKQQQTSLVFLAEVGGMINSWIKNCKRG